MCIIFSKYVYYSNADVASGCNFLWCVLALLQDMAIWAMRSHYLVRRVTVFHILQLHRKSSLEWVDNPRLKSGTVALIKVNHVRSVHTGSEYVRQTYSSWCTVIGRWQVGYWAACNYRCICYSYKSKAKNISAIIRFPIYQTLYISTCTFIKPMRKEYFTR